MAVSILLKSPVVTGVILWVSLRILLHYAENKALRTVLNVPVGTPAAHFAVTRAMVVS